MENSLDSVEQNVVKKETPKKIDYLLSTIRDFCSHAGFDGIQYLTEPNRHWVERIFWLLTILTSAYFGGYMVYDSWQYWWKVPVLISMSEKQIPVSNLPFPAITVCPPPLDATVFNYTDIYQKYSDCNTDLKECNITEKDYERFLAVTQICNSYHRELKFPSTNFNIIEQLFNVSTKLNIGENWVRIIHEKWEHMETLTELGICHTFNSYSANELFQANSTFEKNGLLTGNLRSSQWNLERGYDLDSGRASYPMRILGIGTKYGFHMTFMNNESEFDYLCNGNTKAFSIQLHPPNELPSFNYIQIPMGDQTSFSVHPKIMKTSKSLRNYSPEIRQCYFTDERYLRFFRVYTQNNCRVECIANYTLTKCGCAKFSMPVTNGIAICSAEFRSCYEKAEEEVFEHEFEDIFLKDHESASHISCHCLPTCNSIAYTSEISQVTTKRTKTTGENDQNEWDYITTVKIFFTDSHINAHKRSELYGTTEFIADCGALLGLFLGVSVISVVEFLYFCTLRNAFNKKKQ